MWWAVHPGGHQGLGSAERTAAPDQVLADDPGACTRHVAGALDPVDEGDALGRGVLEVALLDHLVGVAEGGTPEIAVRHDWGEAPGAPLLVDQAADRTLHLALRETGHQDVGVRAARRGGGAAPSQPPDRHERNRRDDCRRSPHIEWIECSGSPSTRPSDIPPRVL